MCLVSVLKKGTEKYSENVTKFITNGFNCNKDGSGYMYKRDGEKTITVKKGFFKLQDLLNSLQEENLTINDELVIHHRIGTSGNVTEENTHPFVCSSDPDEVSAVQITTKKPCLVHNGYFHSISKYMDYNKEFSDTYAFTRYFMGDYWIMKVYLNDPEKFKTGFANILGASKVAILHPDRDVTLIGNFIEKDGYLHSNDGYCRWVYDKGGSSTKTTYSKNWGSEDTGRYYGMGRMYGEHDDFYFDDDSDSSNSSDQHSSRKVDKNNHNGVDTFKESVKNIAGPVNSAKVVPICKVYDDSLIKIDVKNYDHFYFVKKSQWEVKDDIKRLEKWNLDGFDPDDNLQVLFKEDGAIRTTYTEDTDKLLLHDYFYLAKDEYIKMYNDYYILSTSVSGASGNLLKKVNRIVSNSYKKKITDDVYFKRVSSYFCKGAMMMFSDYLTDITNAEAYSKQLVLAVKDEEFDQEKREETFAFREAPVD